jgi:hypothetical protein
VCQEFTPQALDDSAQGSKQMSSQYAAEGHRVRQAKRSTNPRRLEEALRYMQSALKLLDDANCSADIGAHLDLAICRLRETLAHRTRQFEE